MGRIERGIETVIFNSRWILANVSILGWLVGIHLVFVSSMLVLAIVDRLEAASEGTSKRPK